MRIVPLAALLLLVWPAAAAAQPERNAAGWSDAIRLTEAIDANPDPRIIEITLTAREAELELAPGRRVRAWTYDGVVPGPLIRGKVGDRLIVHFRNELMEPTTVHWHGVRVPIGMDGVPGASQDPVQAGGTFTYDFVLRDAGLYWYHPHVMSAAQVGFGLYGALLVEDPAEAEAVGVPDELTLVLSDHSVDDSGQFEAVNSGGIAGAIFGREGADVLVNGKVRPTIRVRAGVPQRWRIVNAAKSRFFLLDLEGQPMRQIGGDGGLQEYPVERDVVLVAAGERVDLIVTPSGKSGEVLTLRSTLYNRGYGSIEFRLPEDLLTIEFTDDPPAAPRRLPVPTQAMTPPSVEGATSLDVVLTLPPFDADGRSEFRVNDRPFWRAQPYRAALGASQIWKVRNDTGWDHPFHLHGYFFTVLDEQLRPVRPLVRKDTVNIPRKTTVNLFVAFDERPGQWMFHCHILDHADLGLMGTVLVGDVEPAPHVHEEREAIQPR
jgi:FtsP/CotA-like multicopper oxidase with cupredoxin domain